MAGGGLFNCDLCKSAVWCGFVENSCKGVLPDQEKYLKCKKIADGMCKTDCGITTDCAGFLPVNPPLQPLQQPLVPLHQPLVPLQQPLVPLHQPLVPLRQPLVPLHQPLVPLQRPLVPLQAPFVPPTSPCLPLDDPDQGPFMPVHSWFPMLPLGPPYRKPLLPVTPYVPPLNPIVPPNPSGGEDRREVMAALVLAIAFAFLLVVMIRRR